MCHCLQTACPHTSSVLLQIVFKNKASRPYSIYPHGLSIEKSEEGVNYPPGGTKSFKLTEHWLYEIITKEMMGYIYLNVTRQPVSWCSARWDTYLWMESAWRGHTFAERLSMSDTYVPQCSGHTTWHCLRTDRTNAHLQESVPQYQECTGKKILHWISLMHPEDEFILALVTLWLFL